MRSESRSLVALRFGLLRPANIPTSMYDKCPKVNRNDRPDSWLLDDLEFKRQTIPRVRFAEQTLARSLTALTTLLARPHKRSVTIKLLLAPRETQCFV